MAQIPVNFVECLNLQSIGLASESIKFGSCSMESDKFICVCESAGGSGTVAIVDLQNNNSITKRPISAQAAIMNPVSKVIALRAESQLQIFNLELRAKMKSHTMTEPVVFWRWISPNTIAIVTASSVLHWSIEGDTPPAKAFDRNPGLANHQVISYRCSPDNKWCLLVGIAAGANGAINGTMQLYSNEKRVSQMLQGHIGTFAMIKVPNRADPAQVLVFEEKKPDQPPKIFIMEVGRDKDAPGGVFRVTPQPIPTPQEAPNDFPVAMQVGADRNVIFMVSKQGYLYMFDILTGKALYRAKIATEPVFVTTEHTGSKGLLGITARTGKVLQVSLNEQTLIPYIATTLRDNQLAISLASRLNLPGAEDLYLAEFNRLLMANDVANAAKLAGESPRGLLRTPQTIQRFQQIPQQPGQPAPVFQYFTHLLNQGALNKIESIELVKPVIAQGRGNLLEKWLTENKLECSEELGDVIAATDINLALSVYLRANVPEKAINCFLQRGEFDKIIAYAQKVGYTCDYSFMLQNIILQNPQGAAQFAKRLVKPPNGAAPLMDPNQALETFMSCSLLEGATEVLLEYLEGDRSEDGYLQTKVLEINLLNRQPQVADAILASDKFHHYDRAHVAKLCEQCGLFNRALEHYDTPVDIKRVLSNAPGMNPEFVVGYFGKLSKENSLECINYLLGHNITTCLQLVVQICCKYSDALGAENLVGLFEKYKSFEGLYYYLGNIVNFSQDPSVHYKYIEAATKMQQFKEVERVCRDSTVYDPIQVKNYLMEAKLQDPRPLIHVCDRFDFVEEMTQFLYTNNKIKYIEVYVTKVSPQKTPAVVGKLLDQDANEDFVRNILNAVGTLCPVQELVDHVERRNRLRLLQPWLEARIATGNTEPATHNAIGKIYITMNRDPVQFLENNAFYNARVLGKFCEKLDPSLAFLAYKRGATRGVRGAGAPALPMPGAEGAGGDGSGSAEGGEGEGEEVELNEKGVPKTEEERCDDDLIRVCEENGLYKDLARYLVERQDLDLWGKVLKPLQPGEVEPASRRSLIDQIVQTALPETSNADEVSVTVKAFMQAEMPAELMELLERIVLHGSEFSDNKNLQNLLILTAIKADKTRVMDYINRLDNFDGPQIAGIAVGDDYELYDEAFTIYTKFGKTTADGEEKSKLHVSAIEVLVKYKHDLTRAYEFAERVADKAVWSVLGRAQLDSHPSLVKEAIQSFLKAEESGYYTDTVAKAKQDEAYEDLVPFLKMARKEVKEAALDTELIYALAKTKRLAELEEFVSAPNVANIQGIGERCFEEGMFEAAKILFASVNNNARLAVCFVALDQYREAVEAAQKANSVSTWKEVCKACIRAQEFSKAATCGLKIIVHPDHLEELVGDYQRLGYFDELISLMEQGLGVEGAHTGVFTQLGMLYSKFRPEKLMEHIKIFFSRINVNKLLRACENALMWSEVVYLYKEDGQMDSAVRTMIEHPACFAHDLFLDCVQKVRNQEVMYRAIDFYLRQHPLQLERLLQVLLPNLDAARVVSQLRKADGMQLGLEYLKTVQKDDLISVNEALNETYVDDEDYESLRSSIDDFQNFDQIALAQLLEKHDLLEFRRIAAYLYKRNKRYAESVSLSKKDKMYKDAIETASESSSNEVVEELLRFFVSVCDKECFAATLYTCYPLIQPDLAMELSWRTGYTDYAMPYMIQYVHHLHKKVKELDERTSPKKNELEEEDAAAAAAAGMMMGDSGYLANGPALLMNTAYQSGMNMGVGGGMPGTNMGGMGMGMGMGTNMPGTNMGTNAYGGGGMNMGHMGMGGGGM